MVLKKGVKVCPTVLLIDVSSCAMTCKQLCLASSFLAVLVRDNDLTVPTQYTRASADDSWSMLVVVASSRSESTKHVNVMVLEA